MAAIPIIWRQASSFRLSMKRYRIQYSDDVWMVDGGWWMVAIIKMDPESRRSDVLCSFAAADANLKNITPHVRFR